MVGDVSKQTASKLKDKLTTLIETMGENNRGLQPIFCKYGITFKVDEVAVTFYKDDN
jgi:hypothetical protein